MPKYIIFDALTDVTITIQKDDSGLGRHRILVSYKWLAQDGETRERPEVNLFPVLQQNNPQALARITEFYEAVVQAIMERDGLA
ncbi:MAG: hypothetical protein H5T59_01130 [Anaerolineae bacterium]|nr:hypothetical protein [Anaerolineae bacterium]